ncbi:MAG: SusC/RagA family TonB-linked outer membrane protein [Balneolales bacterium]
MKYKLLLTLCLLFGFYGTGLAQSQTVEGTVSDAEVGDALPGVNIQVKGTNVGTTTDLDGQYSIQIEGPGSVLVFSYVGYVSEEINAGDQDVIDVAMEPDFARLDEMIVVGYGSVQRSDLTGSVERIDSETFQNQSVSQVGEMLTGTIAGFSASQSHTASGGSSMEVRGPNSLSAGTEPLVVLDGAVYSGDISNINPNDIETIDVLKDASSASIYGSKAASGVILITTTRGATGPPTISFNSKVGVTGAAHDFRPYDAQGYQDYRRSWLELTNPDSPEGFYEHPEKLPEGVSTEQWRNYTSNPADDLMQEYAQRLNFYSPEVDNFLSGQTYDWYDNIIGGGNLRSNTNLSIAGGTDNARYYWSVGYVDNEGVILGDRFSAVRTRLNVDFDVKSWLKVGLNAQYSDRDESSVQASLGQMFNASPYGNPYAEDGSVNRYSHGTANNTNPFLNIEGQDRLNKINTLFATGFAEVALPFGFNHRVSFQPRYRNEKDYNFWTSETITGGQSHSDGYGERELFEEFEWTVDNLLTWNREIGIHNIDLTFLHSVEKYQGWSNYLEAETFSPNEFLGYSGMQFGTSRDLSTNDEVFTADALMARANYSLLGKYLFTASVRRDGFSAFGQESPRATFPAAAFAWQVSEEDFFNVDFINSLKLRVSWGVNGNRDIGIYSSMAQLSDLQYYDGSTHVGTYTNTLANPALRWERTESINAGMDIGILENRINLTLDYYDMSTTDLLMERKLPLLTGFDVIMANLGELANRGFEMTLRTANITQPNFSWRSDFMFSLNRNEIKSLFGDMGTYTLLGEEHEGELPDFDNQWFPGYAIDGVWDYERIGVWQEDEAAEAAAHGMSPGDIKARDVDNSETYDAVEDKMFIGHEQPRFRLGFRNEISFLNNWSASIFVRADLGHIAAFGPPFAGHSTNDRINRYGIPFWTPENRNNEWPALTSEQAQYGDGISYWAPRSFVRIQDASLSYALPTAIAERLQMQNLRIFGSIRNLYTFTNWPGFDPETEEDDGTVGMVPMPRTFTVGLSLSI